MSRWIRSVLSSPESRGAARFRRGDGAGATPCCVSMGRAGRHGEECWGCLAWRARRGRSRWKAASAPAARAATACLSPLSRCCQSLPRPDDSRTNFQRSCFPIRRGDGKRVHSEERQSWDRDEKMASLGNPTRRLASQDRQSSNASFLEMAMADSQAAPTSACRLDDYWAVPPTQDRLLLVEGGDQDGESDRP